MVTQISRIVVLFSEWLGSLFSFSFSLVANKISYITEITEKNIWWYIHSVFFPFSKGEGEPKFSKFQEEEKSEKYSGVGKPKAEGRFSATEEGIQRFKQNLGQRQIWEFWEENYYEFVKKFACSSEYCFALGHLLCIPCLNGSKERFYSNFCIKDQNSLNWPVKISQKFWIQKGGTNFSILGWEKKKGTKIFLKS